RCPSTRPWARSPWTTGTRSAPDCDESYVGTWDGVTAWAPLVDKHWVSATKKFTWTTPTTGTVQDFDRGTFLSFKASAPEASGAVQAIKDRKSTRLNSS